LRRLGFGGGGGGTMLPEPIALRVLAGSDHLAKIIHPIAQIGIMMVCRSLPRNPDEPCKLALRAD